VGQKFYHPDDVDDDGLLKC